MKKELKQFEVSRNGFEQLSDYDYDLMERARTIVLWCLETSYGKNAEHYLDAFQEGAIWCGFKDVTIKNGSLVFDVKKQKEKNVKFYINLFIKFKTAIDTMVVDENDELGLMDEMIQVANIMLKYRYIISLKRKKKGVVEKFLGVFGF